MRQPKHPRGFALVVVLWSVATLALIGARITAVARAQFYLAASARDSAIAEAAARGAIWHAMFEIRRGRWDPFLPATHRIRIGDALVDIAIDAGLRKLNPNNAAPEEMRALMISLGIDAARAGLISGLIVDWRSRDPVSVLGGLKIDQYRGHGLPYRAADRPFETLDELGLLPGMPKDVLAVLLPRLTLFHEGDGSLDGAGRPIGAGSAGRAAETDPAAGPAAAGPLPVLRLTALAVVPGRARSIRSADVLIRAQPSGRGGLFQILTWE